MSYHSYRNIGFVFTDTEANCFKWRKKFTGYDPGKVCRLLGLKAAEGMVYVSYFGRSYRLHTANGVLEKQTEEGWTEELFMNEALVVYHLLGDISDDPGLSGEWLPESQLDPVRIRSGNRTDPLLIGFAAQYAGRLEDLRAACAQTGGKPLKQGDLAYEFRPFLQTPLRLVFWEADEDFPAQVQVYVDSRITDYMHFEAVGCMIADLFEEIGRH